MTADEIRDFLLVSGFKNHRGRREKQQLSVRSVYWYEKLVFHIHL
ncbi:MAG: hypothetical protein Q7U60_12905 [Candidatus Methanoperedens sp.]|nr:hypothetical protein [Candidatus Methanoperedens sp.]